MKLYRDTWMEINLDILNDNLDKVSKIYDNYAIDISSNAFGHGIRDLLPVFLKRKLKNFIVRDINEALELRALNSDINIIVSVGEGIRDNNIYTINEFREKFNYSIINNPREYIYGFKFKQIASLKTKISNIKIIKKGEGVSYGHIYTAKKDIKIATIPIGYADGLIRDLTNKAKVIVRNEYKPIIGRICMDQSIIELDDINANIGDIVVIYGHSKQKSIVLSNYSRVLNLNCFEITNRISRRVNRVYKEKGQIKNIIDYTKL